MDYLCFTIRENKIAIKITDVYTLIDKTELTHFPNQENRSVYIIRYLNYLIPIFEVNGDFDVNSKSIVVINGNKLFGLFVCSIDNIFRETLPEGYELLNKEDFEILVRNGNTDIATQ